MSCSTGVSPVTRQRHGRDARATKMQPTVSVIMAVCNAEAFLDAAVQSVLKQSFGDFEFIIIDDGSTDRSNAMLQDYARKDNRVRLISRANKGLTASLNEA